MNTADRQAAHEQTLHQTLVKGRRSIVRGAGLRWRASSGAVIEMGDWSYVSQYRPEDLVATVGAGTRLSTIQTLLAERGQWLPLIPVDGRDDTIGGAIASGLNGWFSGSMGRLSDRVLGLRVVTPAHGPMFVGSRVVKSVAGYNIPRLFSGTRGALGIITQATLKVAPRPPVQAVWAESGEVGPPLAEALQRFLSATRDWAALALHRESSRVTLYAVWHGRHRVFESLLEHLGPPRGHHLPALAPNPADAVVEGIAPRANVRDLLDQWPPQVPVHIDFSSGSFFGSIPDEESWHRLSTWLHAISGGARAISDRTGMLEQTASSDPLWLGLKQQFDPDGCLVDYKG